MRRCSSGSTPVFLFLLTLSAAAAQTPAPHPAAAAAASSDPGRVSIPVSVTDLSDRLVATTLPPKSFTLLDDHHPQPLVSVSRGDVPSSIAILLDLSASMKDRLDWERAAVREFLKYANPQDEYLLIGFADRPALIGGFTSPPKEIEARLAGLETGRGTALYDAILFSLDELQHARYSRRSLFIVTDGAENSSSHSVDEVQQAVRRAGLRIDCADIFVPPASTRQERDAPDYLHTLSKETGGRTFPILSSSGVQPVAARIGVELRTEYILAFQPAPADRDGRWHKLKVRVSRPPGVPSLVVYAPEGYFAPTR